jgi:hypothetical protein
MSRNLNSDNGLVLFPLVEGNDLSKSKIGNNITNNKSSNITSAVKTKNYRISFWIAIFIGVSYLCYTWLKSKRPEATESTSSEFRSYNKYVLNYKAYRLNVRVLPDINSNVVSILKRDSIYNGQESLTIGWIEIYDNDGRRLGFAKSSYLSLME